MPYMIETWDKPNRQELRKQTRDEHLAYLAAHAGKLLACGAKLNDDGSDAGGGIYIVDVDTRAEAEAFIAADPFSRADLFREVRVVRWRKAYLAGQCCL
ncbi:YciI family protein [Noviherbaspirillum sedimenti]|uniref:YciI family protein n=1 Tax=Noviherbaspirillum sedimenti TaxID=2320865 RepID=A0A3A3G2X9_9BURK|nr:YciI family protein [Noviherbaspirillum sedimenti]RJG02848.1 YciI family protein [Noviherbaspirillum sedimenti]